MATRITSPVIHPPVAHEFRRSSLVIFFLLAYLISWLIEAPLVAAAEGVLKHPISPNWHYLALFGPMAAAILATLATDGIRGVKALLGQFGRIRVRLEWYVIALLAPCIALALSSIIAYHLFGERLPILDQFWRSQRFLGLDPMLAFCIWLAAAAGEEAGWRGYALPRLQRGRSALAATLILSVFWALWHLPTFWYHAGYVGMGAGWIAGWALSLFAGAIVLTWLYNSTRGSLLIVTLFHAALNTAFTSDAARGNTAAVMGTLIIAAAVAIVSITGPAHLSSGRRSHAQLITS